MAPNTQSNNPLFPPDEDIAWPELPALTDNDPQFQTMKILYQAKVDLALYTERVALERETEKGKVIWAKNSALEQAVYTAYVDSAKEAIGQAIVRAQFVQTAAGASGGFYTAILGLAFGASARTVPIRAIMPAVFLGLSIFLAMIYLAFLTRGKALQVSTVKGSVASQNFVRLNDFIRWASEAVYRRVAFLHAAVACFAFGVLFLPIAFMDIGDIIVFGCGALALLIVVGVLVLSVPRRSTTV
jgi:hypothetical protein